MSERIKNLQDEIINDQIYLKPENLFQWVREHFHEVKSLEYTTKTFAFAVFSKISELENSDKILDGAINYASSLGIQPWPNVVGLRLQASSCLAGYLERE